MSVTLRLPHLWAANCIWDPFGPNVSLQFWFILNSEYIELFFCKVIVQPSRELLRASHIRQYICAACHKGHETFAFDRTVLSRVIKAASAFQEWNGDDACDS